MYVTYRVKLAIDHGNGDAEFVECPIEEHTVEVGDAMTLDEQIETAIDQMTGQDQFLGSIGQFGAYEGRKHPTDDPTDGNDYMSYLASVTITHGDFRGPMPAVHPSLDNCGYVVVNTNSIPSLSDGTYHFENVVITGFETLAEAIEYTRNDAPGFFRSEMMPSDYRGVAMTVIAPGGNCSPVIGV